MNSFDLVKFRNLLLAENTNRFYAPTYIVQKYGADKAKEIEANIEDEGANTWDLFTSLETPQEVDNFIGGFLSENTLNENLSYLASWKVLKGPGGYIFQIQDPNSRSSISVRVNKAGMATLDGEGVEAAQAVQQIADQFGTETEVLYGDDSLTTVISEPDFNAIFPDTISEAKEDTMKEALSLDPSSPQISQYWDIMVKNQPEDVIKTLTDLTAGRLSFEEFLSSTESDIYDSFSDEFMDDLDEGTLKEENVLGVYEDPRYGMSVNVFASMRDFDQKLQSNNWKRVTALPGIEAKDIKANIEDLKKKYNIQEGTLEEMASFYKVADNSPEAKAAIAAAKEKYKPGTTLYNTLDTLEKTGEIDYKELAKQTGKDMATFNNPKSRDVLEKDLAAFVQAGASPSAVRTGRPADPNKAMAAPKEKTAKLKITTPKSSSTKLADLAPSNIFGSVGPDDEEMDMEKQAQKAAKGNKRLGTAVEKLAQVTKEMKALAKAYQASKGTPEEASIIAQLKALTAEKKALEKKTAPRQMSAADLMGGEEA
jgi:hypothetical protein